MLPDINPLKYTAQKCKNTKQQKLKFKKSVYFACKSGKGINLEHLDSDEDAPGIKTLVLQQNVNVNVKSVWSSVSFFYLSLSC